MRRWGIVNLSEQREYRVLLNGFSILLAPGEGFDIMVGDKVTMPSEQDVGQSILIGDMADRVVQPPAWI